MGFSLDDALDVFRKHWGYESFRHAQSTALSAILSGEDVICVLPTGGGKSVLFQVPAMLEQDSLTIVVCPLIALMKDQCDDANRRGIPATYIAGTLADHEVVERLEEAVAGCYRLLYIAPERLTSRNFMRAVQRADICRIVVDEAHSISMWGHSFRPSYMHIHKLLTATHGPESRPPILAVTATATQLVLDDVGRSLRLDPDRTTKIVTDPIRGNIQYDVEEPINGWSTARRYFEAFDRTKGRAVFYACTRTACEKLTEIFSDIAGDGSVAFYHAGMDGDKREAVQEGFKSGKIRVVCATTAFGMGIDVSDILLVYNFGVPGSIEDLVQMGGRAARDTSLYGIHVVAVDQYSIEFQSKLIDDANPPWRAYQTVWRWIHHESSPGEEYRASQSQIATSISRLGQVKVSDTQVGAVLRRMASVSLVSLRAVDDGTPVTIKGRQMREFMEPLVAGQTKAPPVLAAAWKALWTKSFREKADEDLVTVFVNKGLVAKVARVQVYAITRALENLRDKKGLVTRIDETYTGNAIKVLEWQAPLEEALPVDRIEAKRNSDFARFHHLMAYTRLPDQRSRVEKIRQYFLADGSPPPPSQKRSLKQLGH